MEEQSSDHGENKHSRQDYEDSDAIGAAQEPLGCDRQWPHKDLGGGPRPRLLSAQSSPHLCLSPPSLPLLPHQWTESSPHPWTLLFLLFFSPLLGAGLSLGLSHIYSPVEWSMWRKLTWLLSRESWGRQPEVSQSLHVPGCPGLQQLWENRHKMSNSREPTGKAQAEGLEAYEELDEMARQRQANQATHVGGWAQKGC